LLGVTVLFFVIIDKNCKGGIIEAKPVEDIENKDTEKDILEVSPWTAHSVNGTSRSANIRKQKIHMKWSLYCRSVQEPGA